MTIEWKKAIKEYKKLNIPENLYNPTTAPLNVAKYFTIVTQRTSGKTTNTLLLGLVCHKLFGTVVQYIRQTDNMLAPKNAKNLFENIIKFGYIEKLTNGKYNNAVYKSRRWYYCKVDNDEITETSSSPCVVCLSIDNSDVYKSSYNAPDGDFIIFDEFCNKRHFPDEFIYFCDLLSTIIRKRVDGVTVWLLGNTIDRYEYYFDEFEISDNVKIMALGEHATVFTERGTPIYIELYKPHKTTLQERVNAVFFGFSNPKLNSITGEDWLITPFQHIDKMDKREIINNGHFICYKNNILQLELVTSEKYGLHIIVHKSTNDNCYNGLYYTTENGLDLRFRYRFGFSKFDRLIWTLYERNKFFYATNNDAAIVKKYVNLAEKINP